MPLFGLAPLRVASRITFAALRMFDTALGRDAEEVLAVFDALPNTMARSAILRTLRSGVDWRGQVVTMLDRAYLAEGVPTKVIWGRRDAIIPLGHGRLAHAALPGSDLEIFDEAGHFPHHTDPERFVSIVSEFIASTVPNTFDADEWRERLRRGRRVNAADEAETDLELMGLPLSPLPSAT
jgi:pimeloyl-ACP methyl ester carboxylesterase